MKKRIFTIFAAILSVLCVFVFSACNDDANGRTENEEEQNFGNVPEIPVKNACPQFSVQLYNTEEEKTFNFSDYDGKVVVINFWATWCAPCKAEMPYFEQLQRNFGDIVVISLHHELVEKDVQSTIYEFGWGDYKMLFAQDTTTSATIISKEEVDGEVVEISSQTELYLALGGSDILPHTAIIDKEGKIAFVRTGSITYGLLENEVQKIINA